MKKLISLLLALVLICSLLPLSAMAAATEEKTYVKHDNGKWYEWTGNELGQEVVDKNLIDALDKGLNEYLAGLKKKAPIVHTPQEHSFGYASNTKYHWLQCACGCQISMEPHVDPKDAENDYCFCGYHFSDNADLVTLWIDGCPPIKGFNKNKTEYTLKIKRIATRTFDSQATVELPEDLTLKEGENKFEIKVTSENQKVTKVYTVIINKEAKK